MSPTVSLLLFTSLSLMLAGLVLLLGSARDELHELSPAEMSTSAPAVRSCWTRLHELAHQARRVAHPRRRRVLSGPRAVVLEMAEISAARTVFCGRISDLWRGASGSSRDLAAS